MNRRGLFGFIAGAVAAVVAAPAVTKALAKNGVVRDPNGWTHFTLSWGDYVFPNERMRVFLNGVEVDDASDIWTPQKGDKIGVGVPFSEDDVLVAEQTYVEGQSMTPDDFGYFDKDGVWKPKRPRQVNEYIGHVVEGSEAMKLAPSSDISDPYTYSAWIKRKT